MRYKERVAPTAFRVARSGVSFQTPACSNGQGNANQERGFVMANKSVCSTRVTVGSERYSYKEYAFFTLTGEWPHRLLRIRHYTDTAKAFDSAIDENGLAILIAPVAVASDQAALDRMVLTLSSIVSDGFYGDASARELVESEFPGLGVAFARTKDHRRVRKTSLPKGRVRTGEGGAGFLRSPQEELGMLLHSDRSSDAFYESASERATRRRKLVAEIADSDPSVLHDVMRSVTSSQVRVPAIMLGVDAAMHGIPSAAACLGMALKRPDDPVTALKYLREGYPDAKIPSAVKRALADAAVRLFDESACVRFDVTRRRGVEDRSSASPAASFRDVLMVARPVPASEQQSALFASILSGYTQVEGLSLLQARRELKNLEPEDATVLIASAAARTTAARQRGERVSEPLGLLPWQELVALSCGPRPGIDLLVSEGARLAQELRIVRHREDLEETYRQERRLRRRLRAVTNGVPSYLQTASPDAIRAFYAPSEAFPLLEVDDETPDWLSLLDDDDRVGYETPRLSASKPQPPSRTMPPAVRTYLAAKEELVEFRSSEAYRDLVRATRPLEKALKANQSALREARRSARPVNPDIWRLTAPSMSGVETLSLLAAFERSGVAEELRDVVRERIDRGRFQIPDILRAARGAALGSARGETDHADHLGLLAHDVSWVRKPKSFWEPVLDEALESRLDEKLPPLPGRLLILVDGSGSMSAEVSGRRNDARSEGYSSLSCAEVAAFAASAIASRCQEKPDLYVYDTASEPVDVSGSAGVLDAVRTVIGAVRGGGTDTESVMVERYDGHDLVVVLTDEQTSWLPGQSNGSRSFGYRHARGPAKQLPEGTKVVTVNLAGYEASQGAGTRPGFVGISGWSEALFEAVADAVRPAE